MLIGTCIIYLVAVFTYSCLNSGFANRTIGQHAAYKVAGVLYNILGKPFPPALDPHSHSNQNKSISKPSKMTDC
jgi:hypothetical protein